MKIVSDRIRAGIIVCGTTAWFFSPCAILYRSLAQAKELKVISRIQ
jgi:hypothetical protein